MSPGESTIDVFIGSEWERTVVIVADFVTAGVNVGSGNGAGAGVVAGARAGEGAEIAAGAGGTLFPTSTAPFSRLTRFSGAVLPAKNSAAVRDGSEDGAGG